MKTLDEIALSFGTDKSSLIHNYTKLYSRYFNPIRYEKLKILEIGIDKGYSLKLWKEYFPNAEITGIDILDLKYLEEERIHIAKGDQKDTYFLKKINNEYGPFDIIIDDGSHNNYDINASFECLFPLLKEGGLYVVEDLHACYWGKTHGTGKPVFIEKIKKLIDYTNSSGKSGCANIQRDKEDIWYRRKGEGKMNWWERNIEFLHLYRSIVFIKRYPFSTEDHIIPKLSLKKRMVRKIKYETKRLLKKIISLKNIRLSLNNIAKYINRINIFKKLQLSTEKIAEYRKTIKIYDIFTFFNELELLEIRLNILDKYVDYFVIVESTETFSGLPKPLYFENNKHLFEKYKHKIIHYIINDTPADEDDLRNRLLDKKLSDLDKKIINNTLTSDTVPKGMTHWLKEFYQKETIKKALLNLSDDDICFVSDVDEIWNPEVKIDYTKDDIFKLKQDVYVYYLNNRSSEPWAGTWITKYKNIKNNCFNHLRIARKTKHTSVENGGWHFTNQGGVEQIRKKIESYGHQEYNNDNIKSKIEDRILNNQDYIGRNFKFWIDETDLPKYILDNKEKYKKFFNL